MMLTTVMKAGSTLVLRNQSKAAGKTTHQGMHRADQFYPSGTWKLLNTPTYQSNTRHS